MHSSPDRDNFVTIQTQNINPSAISNFRATSSSSYWNFGTTYDYNSIMHYGNKAFSRNGGYTMITKDQRYFSKIGQRNGLSVGDIARINNMYKC